MRRKHALLVRDMDKVSERKVRNIILKDYVGMKKSVNLYAYSKEIKIYGLSYPRFYSS